MSRLTNFVASAAFVALVSIPAFAQSPNGWNSDAFLFDTDDEKEAVAVAIVGRFDEDENPYTLRLLTGTGSQYARWGVVMTGEAASMTAAGDLRAAKAAELEKMGVTVVWANLAYSDLLNIELRVKKAKDLQALGLTVNWFNHPFWEMAEWESRIKTANELKEKGEDVNWHDHTFWDLSKRLYDKTH